MSKHFKLFKKDFLLQKKTIPLTAILVLGLLFINKTPASDGLLINFNFITSVFIIATMIVTTSMVHDDKNNVMMMLSGLPIKRKSLVANRYLFTNVVTILCSVLLAIIFVSIDKLLGDSPLISEIYLSDAFFSIAMVNFYFLSIFPLFFKYGYAKTQMFNMIVILVLMGITLIAVNTMPEAQQITVETVQEEVSGMNAGIIMMVLSYITSYFSYRLSVWLFKTREF
jgi:ABC-2 type transport system permease protein